MRVRIFILAAALAAGVFHARPARAVFEQRLLSAALDEAMFSEPNRKWSFHELFAYARTFRDLPESKTDRWQTSSETSRRHGGDCEDKAIWLFTQLKRQGYRDVRLAVGKSSPESGRLHAWTLFRDESGQEWLLDPTKQRRPWKKTDFPEGSYKTVYSFGVERE